MHVGMGAIFQNPARGRSDRAVYEADLRLADLAEPLGFRRIFQGFFVHRTAFRQPLAQRQQLLQPSLTAFQGTPNHEAPIRKNPSPVKR